MRAHCCAICKPDAGHLLRRLQWNEAHEMEFSPEQYEDAGARDIYQAWEQRKVPKGLR